jgi:hypothetical protein
LKFLLIFSWAWWCISVIPALGRQKQENFEFQASLGYIGDSVSKRKKKKERKKKKLLLIFEQGAVLCCVSSPKLGRQS